MYVAKQEPMKQITSFLTLLEKHEVEKVLKTTMRHHYSQVHIVYDKYEISKTCLPRIKYADVNVDKA